MKQIHNIRLRYSAASEEEVSAVLSRADAWARKTPEDSITHTRETEHDRIHAELWIDNQQPVRRFWKHFLEALGDDGRKAIAQTPNAYIDTGTHAFFTCDAAAFMEGRVVLKAHGSVVIRANIACWPATRENAVACLKALCI